MEKNRSKGIQWALRPMFTVNALTGISPDDSSELRLAFHFCAYTLIMIFCVFLTWRMTYDYAFSEVTQDVSKLIKLIWPTFDLLAGGICTYVHIIKHSRVRRNFDDLAEFGAIFPNAFDVKQIRKTSVIQSALCVYVAVVMAFLPLRAIRLFRGFSWTIAGSAFSQYFGVVHLEIGWQFSTAVLLLQKCICCLNFEIHSRIFPAKRFDGSETVKQRSNAKWRHLSRMRKMQLHLYQILRSVEDSYVVSNFLLGFYNLLRVSFVLYSTIDIKVFTPTGIPDTSIVFVGASWIASDLVMLFLVVHSAEKLYAESDKTGKLVSEMILKVKDHRIRRELHLFSLQLLHTKFHFTACGFFPLDFTLLTSMAAAVVTYLVILVQFQESEKAVTKLSCNCSHNILTENGTM
ncbi:Gustatory receptor 14e [Ladona fulva]|uniref:Gustatory receptor n=1 Tax=Ladona fulva TaxID=123851 RepID=A0A8K0KEG7_LADFU|nr:Gustatory receptor 14e [Ladona fulva]